MSAACHSSIDVDLHFRGGLSVSRERAMRAHLGDCESCRDRYERNLMLERITGSGSAESRLRRALRLRPARPAAPRWWMASLGGALAVAVSAVVLWTGAGKGGAVDGFAARGGPEAPASPLVIRRTVKGDSLEAIPSTLWPTDELAFGYRNEKRRAWLMIFAVDASGEVRWYYPAWTNAAETPLAIPATQADQLKVLPDAIAHPLPTGVLAVHLVLSDVRMDVRAAEEHLRTRAWPPGTDVFTRTLTVTR